jgi:hypothetical protein
MGRNAIAVLRITCCVCFGAGLEIIDVYLGEGFLQTVDTVCKSPTSLLVWMRCRWGAFESVGIVSKIWLVELIGRFDQWSAGLVVWNIALSRVGEKRQDSGDFLRGCRLAGRDGDE